uniref:Ribonuclease 3-like n=1 Tax=Nicotiana tabacum TaxID=4097 RepID=A0A1S4BBA1_TOBAC|nr:PREDICTED: ribonuclease 3-like [Nicotiana tabacum]
MMYVLQWPPTYCTINRCKPGAMERFSVHGLWPADVRGKSLNNCPGPLTDEDKKVDTMLNMDKTLEADLGVIWPNLEDGGINRNFWKYQWEKHGLCSIQSLSLMDYFKAAVTVHHNMIAINNKKNLLGYLIDANTRPSNVTVKKIRDINNAFHKLVGNNNDIYISCTMNSNHILLHEIYLCMDATLKQFVSCPPSSNARGCIQGSNCLTKNRNFGQSFILEELRLLIIKYRINKRN